MLENCRIWIPLSFSSACCDPSGGEKRGFWTRKGSFHIFFSFSRFLFWVEYIVTGSRICKTFSSLQVKCSTDAQTKFKVFFCVSIRENFMDLNWSFCCQIIRIGYIIYIFWKIIWKLSVFPLHRAQSHSAWNSASNFIFRSFFSLFFASHPSSFRAMQQKNAAVKKFRFAFFFFYTLSREIGSCKQSVKKSAQNLTRHYSFR